MGAFVALKDYFGKPLVEMARDFGYDESNILILKGDKEELKSRFPDIYGSLDSKRHESGGRDPIDYGRNIVASWLFEDYLLENLKNDSFTISLAGADKNRLILPPGKTSAKSDYVIQMRDGRKMSIELATDFSDYMYRVHKLDLRDNKFYKIKKEKGLLLAIAISGNANRFALIDFRRFIPMKASKNHEDFDNKDVKTINVERDALHAFSFENVINKIIEVMNQKTPTA